MAVCLQYWGETTMTEITDSLYNLTQEQYNSLNESGHGRLIYGDKWPANFAVFLSKASNYEAIQQLAYTVGEIVDNFGLSAADTMELISNYGEEVGLLYAEINSGLITTADIERLLEDSE